MKKYSILFFFLVLTISTYAQSGVNDYKYVQVPSKFDFQEVKNQYRINSTIKMFFEQRGFLVFYNDDVLPQEMASNNCNKLFINVVYKATLFTTKLKIEIKDCTNKVLVTSEEGSSRLKEFGAAYNEALIIALKSLERMKYSGKAITTETVAIENNIIVKPVDNEIQLTTKDKIARNSPRIEGMTLLMTSSSSIYIATSGRKNGVVFRSGHDWFFEYYVKGKLVSEKVYPIFDL